MIVVKMYPWGSGIKRQRLKWAVFRVVQAAREIDSQEYWSRGSRDEICQCRSECVVFLLLPQRKHPAFFNFILVWQPQYTAESPDYPADTTSHRNQGSLATLHTPGCIWNEVVSVTQCRLHHLLLCPRVHQSPKWHASKTISYYGVP